jgi:hypothetical protein
MTVLVLRPGLLPKQTQVRPETNLKGQKTRSKHTFKNQSGSMVQLEKIEPTIPLILLKSPIQLTKTRKVGVLTEK